MADIKLWFTKCEPNNKRLHQKMLMKWVNMHMRSADTRTLQSKHETSCKNGGSLPPKNRYKHWAIVSNFMRSRLNSHTYTQTTKTAMVMAMMCNFGFGGTNSMMHTYETTFPSKWKHMKTYIGKSVCVWGRLKTNHLQIYARINIQ